MKGYELIGSANDSPPPESDLEGLAEDEEYKKLIKAILEWKGRVSPEYIERFFDADTEKIRKAAEELESEDEIKIRDVPDDTLI